MDDPEVTSVERTGHGRHEQRAPIQGTVLVCLSVSFKLKLEAYDNILSDDDLQEWAKLRCKQWMGTIPHEVISTEMM